MAISLAVLISPQQLLQTVQVYYTSTNAKTRIDKMTVTNTTGSADIVTIYLVPLGSSPDATTTISFEKSIAAGETWNCPDLVGQILANGGSIQAVAVNATSLTISAAGAMIT